MWQIISSISTGTALTAFIAAVITEMLRRRLKHRERIIESTPQEDRGSIVLAALEAFSVDTSRLTKDQSYRLAMELIQKKADNFKLIVILIVILATLATGLSAYTIFKIDNRVDFPKEKMYSFDFDNQTILLAISFLDKLSKEYNITIHKDLKNKSIKTNKFSLHLENSKIEDILDSICAKASIDRKINWRKSGKNIFVFPENEIQNAEKETIEG